MSSVLTKTNRNEIASVLEVEIDDSSDKHHITFMLRALLKNDAENIQCSLLMHLAIKLLCYHAENEAKLK